MKVVLYHEVSLESVDVILKEGIKRQSSGVKRDAEIEKVDTFLDTHLPDYLKDKKLSRRSVTYAFLVHDDKIVDISSGELVPVEGFRRDDGMALLKLTVDGADCYVSDLDMYDTLKRAMELDEQDSTREHLADQYWKRVVHLEEFEFGKIRRPEVMINADIDPHSIKVIQKSETNA